MYAKSIEEFPAESLRYTKTEEGSMYYVQIINPTDKEFEDALSLKGQDTAVACAYAFGGVLCL